MNTIRISDVTRNLLMAQALYPWRESGTKDKDGMWTIPVDDEVIAELAKKRLAGETHDDTLQRLLQTQMGAH